MQLFGHRLRLVAGSAVALLTVVALLVSPHSLGPAYADRGAVPPPPEGDDSPSATASLHNPGFDNHDWYFFHDRYDPSYPPGPDGMKPLLPDDDNNLGNNIPENILQDWRLWYMRNTPLIQTFAEASLAQSVEAVAVRTYNGDVHQGGLYQVIYDTAPCLVYQFQMQGRSQPDPGENPYSTLMVGIDRVGWHPDSEVDPAVPGAFPGTTVWGTAHDYKRTYGPLSVTAEALATKISVFTYAYALGGRRHAILWDTGSFQDVTPAMIHDPLDLPAPGGTSVPGVTAGSTSASITWNTTYAALGQVYYRLVAGPTISPTTPLTYTVYLPFIGRNFGGNPWQASALNKTPTTSHAATLIGLQPGSTYAFIAVSRGLSGGQCVTWVSEEYEFITSGP
jgi:hypothetical protein